ncbi:SigE family RNA polymerase sigma factor [Streptomycetaceae bacterium NBC_01309]
MPHSAGRDFEEYARARQQQLHRTAYLLCGDTHRAQDLAQTTLAKLFQHWRSAKAADDIDAYAKTVLTRTYLAEQRSWRRERSLHTPIEPARGTGDPELRLTLLQALAEIPPKPRAMVVLRYWEDMSVEQVAALLRCSPGTVKSQCSRSLDKLRRHLAPALMCLSDA